MALDQPKYDVALSFLSVDEPIAAALHDRISEGLNVFFFPRNQEELAGTDGLESMRIPFLEDSRLVVVLYREPWGKTQWTRVEETAIQEGCLKHGWHRLFFIVLDKASALPIWLPLNHVRFNYSDFGLEQAIGAIKARVLENGGIVAPLTALKRAELSRLETEYLREKMELRSAASRQLVEQNLLELFRTIERLCTEINASGNASMQFAADSRQIHLRNNRVSLLVTLEYSYSPDRPPKLAVREFDKRLAFKGENLFYIDGGPRNVADNKFLPDMNRAREYGWTSVTQPSDFLSSDALADNIVGQFVNLAARAERGEFARRSEMDI